MMAGRVVLPAVCQIAIRPVGKHITAAKENVTLGSARLYDRLDAPMPLSDAATRWFKSTLAA